MSLATDGFSAMINVFPMALAGWVYQWQENARKFSFSSGGNVAEKTVEVKAGKFLAVAGCRSQVAGRRLQVAGGPLPVAATIRNPQPTTHSDSFTNRRGSLIVRSGPVPISTVTKNLTY